MTDDVRMAGLECQAALAELSKLFKPHCKLTLIMRNPLEDDGDMIITSDDLAKVKEAVAHHQAKEAS